VLNKGDNVIKKKLQNAAELVVENNYDKIIDNSNETQIHNIKEDWFDNNRYEGDESIEDDIGSIILKII